jgi:dihydrolipoamide dehydrogenase
MQKRDADLVVLGGGPGGYTAAFRAADLGRSVILIEKQQSLGGVCLNVGCIPSKSLLHITEVLHDVEQIAQAGISFGKPKIDLDAVRNHKKQTVSRLTDGLEGMCKARKIERIVGTGSFTSDSELEVETADGKVALTFNDLIIAVGSRPAQIPGIPYDDQRIWDSTQALDIPSIPKHLVVIGGGIIGMEMAAIYHGLGSDITIVEMTDSIIPPADKALKQPLLKRVKQQYQAIYTATKVTQVEAKKDHLVIHLEGSKVPESIEADAVLVAVGRKANSDGIGIEHTSIQMNERKWITTDEQQQTNVAHIFAIGDVTGDPMLAHRAAHQGKVAAEVASGLPSAFTPMSIPSVAYTQPEMAWIGLTEEQAKKDNIPIMKGAMPWQASGRALSELATEGVTRALFDPDTGRILGAGITGKHAGELIGEALLALEMGAVAEDIALTVHPHPTLSETFAVAAELALGIATDMVNTPK